MGPVPTSSPAAAPTSAVPTYLPWGRTARRLDWAHLPPQVRFDVEARLGSPVVADSTLTHGYVPAIETVLTLADGTHHLLRAASTKAQRSFAASLRAEAAWLRTLPETVPTVRLTHLLDGDWVVLLLEHPAARLPHRPWREDDLDQDLGTPMQLLTAGRLAARLPEVTAGDTLVHTDLRDDTLHLTPDGGVLLDGWAWPVRGAAWLDPLLLLVGPCGDGVDVEAVLRRTPLLARVRDEDVDCVLAAMAGFFLTSCDLPVPAASPWLREFQRWQGEAVWGWLRRRRGWE